MIFQENQNGAVSMSNSVYTEIAGIAAANCFGVKGMVAQSMKDGLYHLLRKEAMGKGVRVQVNEDNSVSISCNIVIKYGFSVVDVAKNVQNALTGAVESMAGVKVNVVNVNVCGIAR